MNPGKAATAVRIAAHPFAHGSGFPAQALALLALVDGAQLGSKKAPARLRRWVRLVAVPDVVSSCRERIEMRVGGELVAQLWWVRIAGRCSGGQKAVSESGEREGGLGWFVRPAAKVHGDGMLVNASLPRSRGIFFSWVEYCSTTVFGSEVMERKHRIWF